MAKSLQALKGKYQGETVHIVGKGPSLAFLEQRHIGPGPVITIAESIVKVEELKLSNKVYSLQKDRIDVPEATSPIILHKEESFKEVKAKGFTKPFYLLDNPADLGIAWNNISVVTAIELAFFMGASNINLVSFDAYTHGDFRTWLPDGIVADEPSIISYKNQAWALNSWMGDRGLFPMFTTPQQQRPDNTVKLIIATPFYQLKGFSPYILSLVRTTKLLSQLNFEFDFWPHDGDIFVDRARNVLLTKFYLSDATAILFIDCDESWVFDNQTALINMIASPYEISAGAYPLKNNWGEFGVAIDTDQDNRPIVCPDTGMLRGTRCSGGFMCIKKSCVEKMYAAYPETQYLEMVHGSPLLIHALFDCVNRKRRRWGEDYEFCKKWEAIGGKVWIEPRIAMGHYGIQGWLGNYHDFLTRQPGGSKAEKMQI